MSTRLETPELELPLEAVERRWQRAFERAEAEAVRPIRIQPNLYYVASVSTPGVAHIVVQSLRGQLGWTCACPAGELHLPCKHVAAVIRLVEVASA